MSKKGWIIGGCVVAAGLLVVALLASGAGYYLYQKHRTGAAVETPSADEPASAGEPSSGSWSRASPEPAPGSTASPSASPIDDIEPDPVHEPSKLDVPLVAREEPASASRASKAPRKLHSVDPVYPDLARQARTQGVVILDVTVDEQGRVSDVAVLRSVPLLDEAAIEAVRQWRYEPTLIDGSPVSVKFTVTVNFTLS